VATNLQLSIEHQRALYGKLARPLLAQLAEIHGLSVRAFAEIFGISAAHSQELLTHKKFPSLELAVRISRYFEVNVEDLFGWRIDDDGSRRTLLIQLPGNRKPVRLKSSKRSHDAMALVAALIRQEG
jgi:DNA-binding XRE family transcriptional regulator